MSSDVTPRPSIRFVLLGALLLALGNPDRTRALEEAPVRLIVEAPSELAPIARAIERLAPDAMAAAVELTGGSPTGPPIAVDLLAEGSSAERAVAPWISGFATGTDRIVLLPSRVDRYPDLGLAPLLRHELTHIFAARVVGEGELPRWFNEGLAMTAGRDSELGDRARVALAVIDDGSLPLARLDLAFAGGEAEVHSAYALAGDFVRDLRRRQGSDVGARLLAGIAKGATFRAAFAATTGISLDDYEVAYWKRRTLVDRWIPVLSSSVLLWGGIALLALAAIRRRRNRDAARLEQWGQDEEMGASEEAFLSDDETWPPVRRPLERRR
ncbi:MAG: hypothetical protein ABI639_08335 [Thermoanaerobaculia bacterium]